MEYRRLGKNGVWVSPLCLGTMNFGWHTSEKDSHTLMDRALDLGINFFDTADVYGWAVARGTTEEIIGRWLAQGGRRDSIVLATKVYNMMTRPGLKPEPNRDRRALSAMKIIRHCEDSLKRLQTDVIDIYQMHHVDRDCPWEEIWQAMDTLRTQGKIIYVGSSNFAGWDIAAANEIARHRFMQPLVSEQSIYHLDNRMLELEVVPACRHYGMGLIPWSPLDGGLLGGALRKRAEGRRSGADFEKKVDEKRDKLAAFEGLAAELGEEPANVALAWLLHNPVVTAPIIGPRTIEQLDATIRCTELKLEKPVLERLDAIFPGPGGEAPKAYAW
ncbi:MAG TPA: aldo/keto reductase [Polyangiaceae bacterium]|nr:aldo/keto reductase [Polyangiaceae bacterium]